MAVTKVGDLFSNPKNLVQMTLVVGVTMVALNTIANRVPQVRRVLEGF